MHYPRSGSRRKASWKAPDSAYAATSPAISRIRCTSRGHPTTWFQPGVIGDAIEPFTFVEGSNTLKTGLIVPVPNPFPSKVSPSGKRSDNRGDFSRFVAESPPHVAVRDDTAHHYALVEVRARGELVVRVFQVREDAGPRKCIDTFRIIQGQGETDR